MLRFWIGATALAVVVATTVVSVAEADASVSLSSRSSTGCVNQTATGPRAVIEGKNLNGCARVAEWSSSVPTELVDVAKSEIGRGLPYVLDGGSPAGPSSVNGSAAGFDCTGLVLYAIYRATGLNGFAATVNGAAVHGWGFQPWLAAQPGVTRVAPWGPAAHPYEVTSPQPIGNLQPGDVLIFAHGEHVAIYAGQGLIVQADTAMYHFANGVGMYPLWYESDLYLSGSLQITDVLRFALTQPLPAPSSPTPASGVTRQQIENHVLWVAATGTAYYADANGVVHWIPDALSYDYYVARYPNVLQLTQAQVNQFGNGQPWAPRAIRRQDATNSILVVSATGTSYYVDSAGTLHWIPSAATFDCLSRTVRVFRGLTQGQVNQLGNGQPWAVCSSPPPTPTPTPTPTPPAPTNPTIAIGWSSAYPSWITMDLAGFAPGTYVYSCDFASGGNQSYNVTVTSDPETFDNAHTCFDSQPGDTVWVTIGSVSSNTIAVGGSAPPPPPATAATYVETTGGVVHTFTDYLNAGGTQGQSIGSNVSVAVSCRLTGMAVADGNTWWYRLASSPWNGSFYASADAFYNNGQTSGSLANTPFVDSAVPLC